VAVTSALLLAALIAGIVTTSVAAALRLEAVALAVGISTLYIWLVSPVAGLVLTAYEKIADRSSDLRWPVTLTLLTGAPLVALWAFLRALAF
jgi:hypothetical protein